MINERNKSEKEINNGDQKMESEKKKAGKKKEIQLPESPA